MVRAAECRPRFVYTLLTRSFTDDELLSLTDCASWICAGLRGCLGRVARAAHAAGAGHRRRSGGLWNPECTHAAAAGDGGHAAGRLAALCAGTLHGMESARLPVPVVSQS